MKKFVFILFMLVGCHAHNFKPVEIEVQRCPEVYYFEECECGTSREVDENGIPYEILKND